MSKTNLVKPARVSDAAVDGLIAGLEAGLIMAAFLIAVEWASSGNGAGVTLTRFDPGSNPAPLTGLMVHLAVSAVYGLVFGFLGSLLNRQMTRFLSGWLTIISGSLYGTAIFLVPWLTFSAKVGHNFIGFSPLIFWLAHVLYGSSLAVILAQMWSRLSESRGAYNLS